MIVEGLWRVYIGLWSGCGGLWRIFAPNFIPTGWPPLHFSTLSFTIPADLSWPTHTASASFPQPEAFIIIRSPSLNG